MPRGIPRNRTPEPVASHATGVSRQQGATVAVDTEELTDALTYEEIIKKFGARYDSATGRTVRIVPNGESVPHKTRDGKWVQASDKRFIAKSLEEAREKGMKWDFYATGLECKMHNCNKLISGWVRGGRKLEQEHDHILAGRYGSPEVMEVSPPALGDPEFAESLE